MLISYGMVLRPRRACSVPHVVQVCAENVPQKSLQCTVVSWLRALWHTRKCEKIPIESWKHFKEVAVRMSACLNFVGAVIAALALAIKERIAQPAISFTSGKRVKTGKYFLSGL